MYLYSAELTNSLSTAYAALLHYTEDMMQRLDSLAFRFRYIAPLLLRFGLAIVFLLFAYHKLNLNTTGQGVSEIKFLYDLGLGTASALNYYAGLLELAVGIALVIGWRVRLFALVACGMILFIWISYIRAQGLGISPDLYRDLGLAAAALALFLLADEKKEQAPTQ